MVDSSSPTRDAAVRDALFDAALRWHLRLRESTAGSTLHDSFQEWLANDDCNRAAFTEVEELFGSLASPAKTVLAEGRSPSQPAQHTEDAPPPGGKALRPLYALAAGLAALAFGAAIWLSNGTYDRLRSDAYTRTGEIRDLRLPDGSELTLNTDTAVAFRFDDRARSVELLRGEAFFSVQPDATKPFHVTTPTATVRVVGTRFNVRVTDNATTVSVEEGIVDATSTVSAPVRPFRLVRGDAAALGAHSIAYQPGNPESTAAWRRGKLIFFRAPLAKVTEEIERYDSRSIVIASERLKNQPVTGVFNTSNPREAIAIIEATLHVRSVVLPAVTILY